MDLGGKEDYIYMAAGQVGRLLLLFIFFVYFMNVCCKHELLLQAAFVLGKVKVT